MGAMIRLDMRRNLSPFSIFHLLAGTAKTPLAFTK
jgi:hypothetical protein